MSKIKKLIALTLALAMILSVSAFAGYKVDTYADAAKIDVDCKDAVELLYALDIMVGDGKNFNPQSAVTRAEMAKMIYVILNYGKDDKAVTYTGAKFFTDVEAGYWAEGYINYCASTKLIAGRGDGTFGPTDAVTTAEAAKMLLTAIGYSAEHRGYIGANWDKNVLSDAAIIGLLDGYKSNVNLVAPRQWVAVMIENMLLGAYTYGNMAPNFSGLLVSGVNVDKDGKDESAYETMGQKYYDLNDLTRVAVATYDARIAGTTKAAEGKVRFTKADGTGAVELKNTGLKAADLGQSYRLIYNTSTMKAYSVRSLSETAEARTLDMEVDVLYSTSSNKAQNKYEFTIGEMSATFEDYKVNVLYSGTNESSDGVYTTISVDELRGMIEADTNNNVWKAIDTDVDGKIDYFYVTEYDYAYVTDDGNHSKYGDYIYAEDLNTENKIEFNGETRLYVKDCIISADEIAEDVIVKYTWNLDKGMYEMEVLKMAKEVTYAARDIKTGIHELKGDFMIADEADVAAVDVLVKANLGKDMDYVYDGDLIIWIAKSDSNYTNISDINAQLVLVLDVMDQYSNGKIREQNAIEYMTIDGETHIAAYQDGETGCVNFNELKGLADVLDNTKRDDDKSDWEGKDADNKYAIEGRLFILHSGTKGRVYLEALSNTGDDPNEQLDASDALLDTYRDYPAYTTLDATGTSAKLAGNKLVAGNSFFYGYFNSYGEAVYGVITPEKLAKAKDTGAYAQVLTLDNSKNTRTTVVAGYIFTPDMVDDTDDGYLVIDKIERQNKDGLTAKVTFLDGTTDTVVIKAYDYLVEGYLYKYNYNIVDDVYTLTLVGVADTSDEISDIDGYDVIFSEHADIDIEDATIVIVNVEINRDENADELNDEALFFEYDYVGYEILKADDLDLAKVEDDSEGEGYVQYTDWAWDPVDEVLYVVVFNAMDRYTGVNLTDSPLTGAIVLNEDLEALMLAGSDLTKVVINGEVEGWTITAAKPYVKPGEMARLILVKDADATIEKVQIIIKGLEAMQVYKGEGAFNTMGTTFTVKGA